MPDAANIDYYYRFGALGILMFVALPPGYKWGAALNIMLMPRPITPFGPSLSPWPSEIMARLKSRSRRPTSFWKSAGSGAASQWRAPDPYLHPDHVRILLGIRSIKAVSPGGHAGLVCWLGWASDPWPYTVGISSLGIDSSP